ncbi:MAG: citrate synthase, partial [Gordonia polyisoprenivorans]|nr:citrate synthase [Gordonia polyisoprenivorans]
PLRHHIEPAAVTEKATRVLITAVDALAPGESEGSLAQRLWPRLTDEPATPRAVKVLNAALVALADHDLAAGTVAARVAASARGSVYAVIGAGLGAFDGPMHGGATTLAYRFLADALDDPTAAIADALYADTPIPGTGHVIYRAGDPRATVLLEMLARSGGGDRRVQPAVAAIVDAVGPSTFVNSDLALAALALRYRMRPDAAETIFALARIAGWIAHALEEYQAPRLRFRPEGVYTGVRPSGAHAT